MLFMGSTFIINITKEFFRKKGWNPSLHSLILSQRILTDVLREETTQDTEVDKVWLHNWGKSLKISCQI